MRRPVPVTRGNSTVLGDRANIERWAPWWAGKIDRGRPAAVWSRALPTSGSGPAVAGILHVPCKPMRDEAWYRVRPLERLGPRYAKRIKGVWWWMPAEPTR